MTKIILIKKDENSKNFKSLSNVYLHTYYNIVKIKKTFNTYKWYEGTSWCFSDI